LAPLGQLSGAPGLVPLRPSQAPWFHLEYRAGGRALSRGGLSGRLLWAGLGLGWTLLTLAVMDGREFVLLDMIVPPLIPTGLMIV
jgi:hypothetical protein